MKRKLIGHITDGIGFMAAPKDNDIDPIGKKMTIVGCGGIRTRTPDRTCK